MPFSIRKIATLEGHQGRCWHAEWSPDGNLIASCGEDRIIRIWKPKENGEWKEVATSHSHGGTIRRCAWSPDSTRLATCSFDKKTVIHTVEQTEQGVNLTIQDIIEGHESEVKCVAFSSADDALIATCGRDRLVYVWSADDLECLTFIHKHTQDIKCVVFHPTLSRLLVSASYDDSIIFHRDPVVWNGTSFPSAFDPEANDQGEWKVVEAHTDHKSTVWDIAFETQSKLEFPMMASASADGTVIIWKKTHIDLAYAPFQTVSPLDPPSISPSHPSQPHPPPEPSVCLSVCFINPSTLGVPGFVVATNDGSITLYTQDEQTGEFMKACFVTAHVPETNSVRHSSIHGSHLVTTGDDGLVNIWHIDKS
ncbi:putative Cytosolic iron-sulfur protein assembly protein 1 [Blattamonas nauphoetae]|uniref:Cytosolic iron-sulfur protein assembly protein 1 n=1 Tax=Blattamonas nauphoetae TaxID=2049346 RepID=A0ABQ9XKU9_9EUKA|nr:putative Cytosolic iron-sulfur protein assembly protein 1 [Blattamonas nauphoetae]